ncbi:hypothetical protein Scep_006850 [Stephania cephalantha]|uniref:Uncharacterized protein n=1 Tax=Stephania cephalantha TaxID=152367 RepID=A0AAP0K8M8_9MAGN
MKCTPHPRLIRSSASRHTIRFFWDAVVRAPSGLEAAPPDLEPIVPTGPSLRAATLSSGGGNRRPYGRHLAAPLWVRHYVTSRGLRVDHHRDRADLAGADVPHRLSHRRILAAGEQSGRREEIGAQRSSWTCGRAAAAARRSGASTTARAREADWPIPDETQQRTPARRGSDEAQRRDGLLAKKTECVDLG